MAVTKSNKSNITSPNGNSLALFVDINDDKLKMKDINGEVQPLDDFVSVSGGTLQIEGGALINATLQNVTDAENNVSQLQLATNATKINGNLEVASALDVGANTNIDGNTLILGTLEIDNTTKIKTNNETYLDVEDGSGNNRLTISRPSLGQKVAIDFASNPSGSTEIVGSIRTYQDGTNLSDTMSFRRDGNIAIGNITPTSRLSIKGSGATSSTNSLLLQNSASAQLGYIDDSGQWQIGTGTNGGYKLDVNGTTRVQGQVTFAERVNIEADSLVTTQTSSVIASTTTNANMVIAPNGTGALIASIPDGSAGGNARGANSVDLQISRGGATQIASGVNSVIGGGSSNTASGARSTIAGGLSNSASGNQSFVGGGQSNSSQDNYCVISGGQSNTAATSYCTVSGGQSNTASTNTHATVVGGASNTSSGTNSISGGNGNIASASRSISLGSNNNASGNTSTCFGESNLSSSIYSLALGFYSKSYLYAQLVCASGRLQAIGDAQQSLLTARREATLTTGGTTTLSLDGTGTTNLIIPTDNNRMWKVKVEYVATISVITGTATGLAVGNSVYGEANFGFKRVGGTSSMGSFINDSQASDNAIMDTCSLAYSAGASQELALTFTAPTFAGGGSVTMRVVAKVSLVEVAY